MIIKEISNKKEWEDFVLKQQNTLFVQSYNHGNFYKSIGENFWIFGIYENEKLVGGSLIVSIHAKRGNFLYLPYGPILDYSHSIQLKFFTNFLKDFAKKNRYDFIRTSPFIDDTEEHKKMFKECGFRGAPMHILAETTWMLSLDKSEDDLLMSMNKNHRNLIRRCIREEVRIEKKQDKNDLQNFYKLHKATASRHNFHNFSDEYISKEFDAFNKEKKNFIYYGYLPDNKLDSSAIIFYYGNMAVYRHGASLSQNRKIPTSYLIQWEVIKDAKNQGIKQYNFWGIAPDSAKKNHPFKGITHFKKGFGGCQKNLLHCQDLPVSIKYIFAWTVETIRRKKRGF